MRLWIGLLFLVAILLTVGGGLAAHYSQGPPGSSPDNPVFTRCSNT